MRILKPVREIERLNADTVMYQYTETEDVGPSIFFTIKKGQFTAYIDYYLTPAPDGEEEAVVFAFESHKQLLGSEGTLPECVDMINSIINKQTA